MSEPNMPAPQGEMILYQTEDGHTRLECRFAGESIWLTQADMARLFGCSTDNVSLHLKNIYQEGELDSEATTEEFSVVRVEGSREVARRITFYNLDAIISVGYRVKSLIATRFRIWATQRLREYIVKGFALDDERLKNPPGPGAPDYFDEMLERIRDIRSSERRMYLQVRNILRLAADYDAGEEEARQFFQTVQNKLHFAATGKTAPELIAERANHEKPNMGLTAWKGGVVRKGDVTIAKNYLREEEIEELNRIVTMFLDFAEDQARRRRQVFMRDWRERLDDFLRFNERGVLPDKGQVSREEADRMAHEEYEQFHRQRLADADAQAEADTLRQLAQMVKSLPRRRKKKHGDAS